MFLVENGAINKENADQIKDIIVTIAERAGEFRSSALNALQELIGSGLGIFIRSC